MSEEELFDKLAQIVDELGWNMIVVATPEGDMPGIIIGNKIFTDNVSDLLSIADDALESNITFKPETPENRQVPESRLKPKKDDDDPTFH